jgi:hypothetical protein
MPIQNTDTTLAREFGVSGTLSARKGLFPVTPLTMVWRRMLEPADALLSAVGVQGGIALAERTINILEGQWVTLDSSGKAILAPNAAVGAIGPVWSGGDRLDPKGGITTIQGAWVADTSFFATEGAPYLVGTLLQIGTGTVQGAAATPGCLTSIVPAAVADIFKVVAIVERGPYGTAADTPSGVMRIRRILH